jgi:hypothetical protein
MAAQSYAPLKKIVLFVALLLFLTGLLALLNWFPLLMQDHKLKKYESVDAARKELRMRKIYLPTYIPEHLNLAWPPAEIYGQDVPFNAVITHLTYRGKKEIGLIIHQIDASENDRFEPRMKMRKEGAGTQIFIKDRKAVLVSAICYKNTPCNQVSWDEGGTVITLIGTFPARDIIRIASSMIAGP